MRLGRFVVAVERGGDGESIRDPGRRGCVLSGRLCAAQVSPGCPRPALDERRPACAEQRLRLHRRRIGRSLPGLQEILLGGSEVAVLECDVAQPEEWLRGVVESFGEREVEPACHVKLSGGQRGCGDRETVPEQLPGVRRIVLRRPVGAGGERGKEDSRRGRTQAARGRRS